MELKDVILSTLAEMEDVPPEQTTPSFERKKRKELKVETVEEVIPQINETEPSSTESELLYLNSIKERLLVLFEGF